uniref:Uncharacterized protein n=1 Tax=Acrobeloides nanus TaxID=290746 RepID=A0A914EM64_9BILA
MTNKLPVRCEKRSDILREDLCLSQESFNHQPRQFRKEDWDKILGEVFEKSQCQIIRTGNKFYGFSLRSRLVPLHTYRFVKQGVEKIGQDYLACKFVCEGCLKMQQNDNIYNDTGLPEIFIDNKEFVEKLEKSAKTFEIQADPDRTNFPHLCNDELSRVKLEEDQAFRQTECYRKFFHNKLFQGKYYIVYSSNGSPSLHCESKATPGHFYAFTDKGNRRSSGAFTFRCGDCLNTRKREKMSNQDYEPYALFLRGKVVSDPDNPQGAKRQMPHYCLGDITRLRINFKYQKPGPLKPVNRNPTNDLNFSYSSLDPHNSTLGLPIGRLHSTNESENLELTTTLFDQEIIDMENSENKSTARYNNSKQTGNDTRLGKKTCGDGMLHKKRQNSTSIIELEAKKPPIEPPKVDYLLTETNPFTKNVPLCTDQWTIEKTAILAPSADIPIPTKRRINSEELQWSEIGPIRIIYEDYLDHLAKSFDEPPNKVLICDSLLEAVDENSELLKNAQLAVVHANFPISPKLAFERLLYSNLPKESLMICALGYDLLLYSKDQDSTDAIKCVRQDLKYFIEGMIVKHSRVDGWKMTLAFVTIPEKPISVLSFESFNQGARKMVEDLQKAYASTPVTVKLFDWAEWIAAIPDSQMNTVSKKISLLISNILVRSLY